MNKYKLNVLRFLTNGKISDGILKKSFNHRIEKGKFCFKFKASLNTNAWRMVYGSTKD